MAGVKLHTSVDAADPTITPDTFVVPSTTTTSAFVRPVQIHESDMSDPKLASLHMRRLQAAVNETTEAARSDPEQGSVTFKGVLCGAGGAKVQIAHNLGHMADFIVVRWRSAPLPAAATAAGHSLVSDEEEAVATRKSDVNNLYLKSYVAGVANIRVF